MHDLRWVRKQGQIIEREKKKIRQSISIPVKEKIDSYAELYEAFEQRIKDTESIFLNRRISQKIELQKLIMSLNHCRIQPL